MKKPTVLMILDGWGISTVKKGNAVLSAKTPNLDRLMKKYPHMLLEASGESVGLDDNQVSGSETGHSNIGAGRIVIQDSHFISESIKSGEFFLNPVLTGAVRNVQNHGSKLHIMGLMSSTDSPHASPEHFRSLLRLAKSNGLQKVYCHLFTDGRDSFPKSALEHLKNFQEIMKEESIGEIASISGRFYAMDRSKNWKRLARAFDAIVFGRAEKAKSASEAIEKAYKDNLTDEYVVPTVICEGEDPIAQVSENDSLIFFNYRSDRARQFAKLFVANNPDKILADDMPVIDQIPGLYFVAMTDFGPDLNIHTAFPTQSLKNTLPMALARYKQLYIAEREKYAHVTYFFNGGYADPVGGEDRVMIESVKADNYLKCPEMSAGEITRTVLEDLKNGGHEFIAINYANADMVGHTGNLEVATKAVEFVDQQVGLLADKVLSLGGTAIITADHGNAEEMIDSKNSGPNTFHSKNPVPFILAGEKFEKAELKKEGVLGNIAPTILDIMEIEKPAEMIDSLL